MNPYAPEEMTEITPPPLVQKPGAYYSLEAAARRQNTPFLSRLKAWLTNRPDEALDERTGGREMLSPDVFYKQAIEAPAAQRPGKYDWLDSLAHTLTGAMLVRGGVNIPEWAQGHPMIKRYGVLKERGILNEAEYEQGINEQLTKLAATRARTAPDQPISVIDQLERMKQSGAQQVDAGPPVEALPLVSPGRGNLSVGRGETGATRTVYYTNLEAARDLVQGAADRLRETLLATGNFVDTGLSAGGPDLWTQIAVAAHLDLGLRLRHGPSESAIRETAAVFAPMMRLPEQQVERILRAVRPPVVNNTWPERFLDAVNSDLRRHQRPRTVAPAEFPTEAQGWSVVDNSFPRLSELGPRDLPINARVFEFQRRLSNVEPRQPIDPYDIMSDSPDWFGVLANEIMARANTYAGTRQASIDRDMGRYISELFGITTSEGMRVFRDLSRWSGRGDPGDMLNEAYSAVLRDHYPRRQGS